MTGMITKIGYTGSRDGMTEQQADMLFFLLHNFRGKGHTPPSFMHGDCVGADAAAHEIAHMLGYHIIIRPQNTAPDLRAHCDGDEILPAMAPLDRNRAIVDWSEILLAAPPYPYRVRSGSWYTYNYAFDQKKRAWLL
jgi:hypothetical protein